MLCIFTSDSKQLNQHCKKIIYKIYLEKLQLCNVSQNK
jgi:hypothetical protein